MHIRERVKNSMEKVKVLAISPYEGLGRSIQAIAPSYPELDIHVAKGNLERAVEIAKRAEKDGFDLILSRGGTASMLQKEISIPVVTIAVSGYDLLRTLKLAQIHEGKTAVVGFERITQGCEAICELLGIDMHTFTISSSEEMETLLGRLKAERYSMIIGDVATTTKCDQMGMNSLLITSGEESIRQTLDAILPYARTYPSVRESARIQNRILQNLPGLVAALAGNGEVIYISDPGKWEEWKTAVQEAHKVVLGKGKCDMICATGNRNVAVHGERIGDLSPNGCTVFYVHGVNGGGEQFHGISVKGIEELKRVSYNILVTKNPQFQQTLDHAQVLGKSGVNILVSGERGVGKDMLAYSIHNGENGPESPLLCVDCESAGEQEFAEILMEYETFIEADSGDIYFKNLDCLGKEGQIKLIGALDNHWTPRILASSTRDLEALVESGEFLQELWVRLRCAKLWIPPLRNRIEDMEHLCGVIIGRMNRQTGKQVVGVERQAFAMMKKHQWTGNIDQLTNVMTNAMKICTGFYIRKKDITPFLTTGDQGAGILDLSRRITLEEMTREIIFAVLKDENMNQVKAAERLGISRTTLWRKLQ